MGNTFNQNHSGKGDNIINFGRQRFEMTPGIMVQIAQKLGSDSQVQLFAVGSSRSQDAAMLLAGFLNERGIRTSLSLVGMLAPPLAEPVEFRNGGIYVNADI